MSVKRADRNSGCLEPIRCKKKCSQREIIKCLAFTDDICTAFSCVSPTASRQYIRYLNCLTLFGHLLTPDGYSHRLEFELLSMLLASGDMFDKYKIQTIRRIIVLPTVHTYYYNTSYT